MIIAAVELFSEHMRACLLSGGGSGAAPDARLTANLRHLRETYDSLLKLDLPSQPLSIVEKVIFDYRVHGMTVFLTRAHKRVKGLAEKETWKIEEFSDYGAITNLPHLLETYMTEALASINKCVLTSGRREAALLSAEPAALAQRHAQNILLAFVAVLRELALNHDADQDFNNTSLSVALDQPLDESRAAAGATATAGGRTWQQRLLIAGANAHYTRRAQLPRLAQAFVDYGFPKPVQAIQATKDALTSLEANIAETYLEHKGDPLVGTIEPSMYMGRHKLDPDAMVDDARPYVYEIINNLIAVHAEVDSVCGAASSRYVRDICETVCEELARLAACAPAPLSRAAAFQARLEYSLLQAAAAEHLTRKAENYLMEALAGIPPLETEEDKKRMDELIHGFKKRMELQLASLNCNMETV